MYKLPVNFKIIWFGQLLSNIGMGLTVFALGIYVFRQTALVADFAMIAICSFVPSFILRPLGGVVADRFDRALVMIITDIGASLGVIIIIISITAALDMRWVYMGLVLCSVFNGFQSPAYKALLTDILDKNLYARAAGLVQMVMSSQHLFSPLLAGFLLYYSGIREVLAINLLAYITAGLCTFAVKNTIPSRQMITGNENVVHELKEGWKILIQNKKALLLTLIISTLTLFMGYLQTLVGPMVLAFSTPEALGTAQSIGAAGMVATGLYIGIKGMKNERAALIGGMLVVSVALIFIGLRPNLFLVAAAVFVFFCSLPFINTSADVMIRTNIDNAHQGRVWGIIGLMSQAGFIVAYCTAGIIADRLFNPLLANPESLLANTAGMLIGVGAGRGIALFLILCGFMTFCLALFTMNNRKLRG